jgi:hypothetical protein
LIYSGEKSTKLLLHISFECYSGLRDPTADTTIKILIQSSKWISIIIKIIIFITQIIIVFILILLIIIKIIIFITQIIIFFILILLIIIKI